MTAETCHCGGRNGEHWHRCPDKPTPCAAAALTDGSGR